MEYVSVLEGGPFTSLPGCTHPALAALATQVNDNIAASKVHEAGDPTMSVETSGSSLRPP